MWRPAGSVLASSCSLCSTPLRTSRMLEPICWETFRMAAGWPLPATSVTRSGAPGKTSATSDTRSAAPFLTRIGALAISLADFHRPEARTRYWMPAVG